MTRVDLPADGTDAQRILARATSKAVRRLLPLLVLMYIVAFIDRSNVGFSKDALQADSGISDGAFALGAGIFFIAYALFEVPSNLLMYKFGARRWMSRIMVSWGLVSACTALTDDAASFYVLRFLLGIAEAGFFPGVILFLTQWFPTKTRGEALGLFYFGLPLAQIVGSPLSGVLLEMHAPLDLHSWQWLFIVEGLLASAVGVVAFFYLTDRPADAAWLTAAERTALSTALHQEDARKRTHHHPKTLLTAIKQPRVVLCCAIYFTIQVSVYGIVFYLPTRIADLLHGHVGTTVGFLTAIPSLAALPVIFIVTRSAGRCGHHCRWAAAMMALAGTGLIASTWASTATAAVLAFCLATGGAMASQPLFWVAPTAYLRGAAAAGGIALINSVGNLGGFFAPNVKTWVELQSDNAQVGMIAIGAIGWFGAALLLFLDRTVVIPLVGES